MSAPRRERRTRRERINTEKRSNRDEQRPRCNATHVAFSWRIVLLFVFVTPFLRVKTVVSITSVLSPPAFPECQGVR